jgi:tetratricopeptide (TPR) repeat protein
MRQQEAFEEMSKLVGEVLKRLRSRRLAEQLGPETRVMQQKLLGELRKKMLQIVGDAEARGVHSFGTVAIYQSLGDLLLKLGQGYQARQQYEDGRKLAEKILKEQPNNDRARANLGIMMMRLGDIDLEVNGDAKAARDYYQKGWDLQNEVCVHLHDRDFPVQQKTIVLSHHAVHLGRACLGMGRATEAAKHFEQALKLRQEWAVAMARNPESRGWLVEVNMWLGTAAWHREDAKAFPQYFQEGLQLMEALVKEFPGFIEFKGDLAEVYAAHAEGLVRLGRLDEARTSYQRAWENLKLVMDHDPDDPSRLPLLALLHERLGADAQRRGQQSDAHKHYQEALSIRQEFTRLEPENRVPQAAYLLALARCGKHAEAARGADALRPQAGNSTELLLQLARCYAVCASQASERQGPLSKALEALRVLAALDYRDPVLVRTDPDLAALRTEPAFLSLLDKWDKERE